ncbi:MAG: hypothetical protein V9F04_08475 [Dermatophilaceae bacterium]
MGRAPLRGQRRRVAAEAGGCETEADGIRAEVCRAQPGDDPVSATD